MKSNQEESESLKTIETTNPANGELIKEYQEMSNSMVSTIVEATHNTFTDWRRTDFDQRSKLMNKAAEILESRKNELASLMTQEMGKVFKEGIAEVEKCVWVCKYYAKNAINFLADEEVETEMQRAFVSYQPIGVVLAVMPWNYPFWQVFRFAAPTLMAGNTGLLKHAGSVSGCALAIESIFEEAGFPDNCFRTLLITKDKVESVIENKHVRAVTLTGSTNAGRIVAAQAGKNLKKTVLELGGSDAYIVLDDADIEHAAEQCATSRFLNGGQSCIAAKRFIVVETAYDEFVKVLTKKIQAKVMGDPNDDKTDLGPQANLRLRDELHKQVEESIKSGAKCVLGGEIPDKEGAWYPPTLLTEVEEGMPAYEDELFGPVASVIKAKEENHAIEIANSSNFGLGGAVFTKDIDKGTSIARDRVDSGAVVVNGFVKSDPRLPFGGVKDSGYGRELSRFGIHEFVNIKAVSINE